MANLNVKQLFTNILNKLKSHDDKIGDTTMGTRATTLKGAIAELEGDINSRTRKQFTDLTLLVNAVAEQNLAKYGLAIGDYYVGASGYVYTIADMDTYYGGYNSYAVVNTHHVALVVKTGAASQWYTSNDTSAGYNGSTLHSYLKGTVLTNVKSDLGSAHILSHSKLLTTGTATWAWQLDQSICALSEVQVYGSTIWSMNEYQEGEACRQLEIFRKFRFNEIFGNIWFWLRNIYSASHACNANHSGDAGRYWASNSGGAVGLILFH